MIEDSDVIKKSITHRSTEKPKNVPTSHTEMYHDFYLSGGNKYLYQAN